MRGLGGGIVHLADVPDDAVDDYTSFGAPFKGVSTPVVALCGDRVRSVRPVVVLMDVDSKVSCRHCRRWEERP